MIKPSVKILDRKTLRHSGVGLALMLRPHSRVLPFFHGSLWFVVLYLGFMVVLPLGMLFSQVGSLGYDAFMDIAFNDRTYASYGVTLLAAGVATLFNGVFGVLLAWVLTRYEFFGRRLLDGLVDLPFALPTAVAGITLVSLYDETGLYGRVFTLFGIEIAYTWIGVMVAMAFTSMPFVVRTIQPVLQDMSEAELEASQTLGASPISVFWTVVFPQIRPALVTGMILSMARSLGEFGAIVYISGNIPFETEVVSLLMMVRLDEYDYPAAVSVASVVLGVSIIMMVAGVVYQRYALRYLTGGR